MKFSARSLSSGLAGLGRSLSDYATSEQERKDKEALRKRQEQQDLLSLNADARAEKINIAQLANFDSEDEARKMAARKQTAVEEESTRIAPELAKLGQRISTYGDTTRQEPFEMTADRGMFSGATNPQDPLKPEYNHPENGGMSPAPDLNLVGKSPFNIALESPVASSEDIGAKNFMSNLTTAENLRNENEQKRLDREASIKAAGLRSEAGTGGEESIQSDAAEIKAGRVPPSVAFQGRDPKHARAVRMALSKDGFNLAQAGTAYTYWSSPKTQGALQTINNFIPNVDALTELSDRVSRLGIKAGNQRVVDLQSQLGDIDANNFLGQLAITQDELMGALAGASNQTDAKLEQARRTIGPGMTIDQLRALVPVVVDAVNARKLSIYRQAGPYGKAAAQEDVYLPDNLKSDIASGRYGSAKKENPVGNGEKVFATEAEAEASGYKGPAIINGRRAVLQ